MKDLLEHQEGSRSSSSKFGWAEQQPQEGARSRGASIAGIIGGFSDLISRHCGFKRVKSKQGRRRQRGKR